MYRWVMAIDDEGVIDLTPAELKSRAARLHRIVQRWGGTLHHDDTAFACGREWHRIAALLKERHHITIYRA
jgi:hypothetical protein